MYFAMGLNTSYDLSCADIEVLHKRADNPRTIANMIFFISEILVYIRSLSCKY